MTWPAVLHYLAVILRKPSKQLNYFLFTNLSYVVCIILHILIAFYHYIHLKRRKIYSPDFSCCVHRAPCLGHRFFNAACHAQAFSSSYFSRTVKGTVTREGEGGSIYFFAELFQEKKSHDFHSKNKSMQTGSSGTLIGWKSGQTTFVPLWDRMEGAWLQTQVPYCLS